MNSAPRRTAVILASAGRPHLLAEAIGHCRRQQDVDVLGIVSVPDDASLPADRSVLDGWEVVTGVRGLAAQRNAGLDRLAGRSDTVFFFDDDAVPREDYLLRALDFFCAQPDFVGMTGRVLIDGKLTGEIDTDRTERAIRESHATPRNGVWRAYRELYGANFGVRVVAAPALRFDGRLPLYSWLEDHDFARRLRSFGPLAYVEDCVVVHRAASSGGRMAHARFGYSQVANPIHLWRSGSFPSWLAAEQLLRPVSKNVVLAIAGPTASWRRQRLRGNLRALRDLLAGQLAPGRAVDVAAD